MNEVELRAALAHVDTLMILLPKMARELTKLKDLINEEIIRQQRERMKIGRGND